MKDNRSARGRREINHMLGKLGLAQLNEPGLVSQLAYFVRDHEHFRQMLATCEPTERRNMYEALRPHLTFEARPLDVYLAEAADLADRKQLPQHDPETGALTAYTPYSLDAPAGSLEAKAEKAIHDGMAYEATGHMLKLVCAKCTREAHFYGETPIAATIEARQAGWVYDELDGTPREICPKCPAVRTREVGVA